MVIALNISTDMEAMERLKTRWSELDTDILLVAKYSPFRTIVTPLIKNIELIANSASEDERITVIVPQFVTKGRLGEVLHNHTSLFIRETILKNNNIIVSTFPYHLEDEEVCD